MSTRTPNVLLGLLLAGAALTPVSSSVAAPLTITTASLPGSSVGRCYSFTLTATGGTPPYMWMALTTPPAGIRVTPTGSVEACSPTFTQSGTFTVAVRVYDHMEESVQRGFMLTVAARPTVTSPTSPLELPKGAVGVPYRYQLTATGGIPPLIWARSFEFQLPPGLTLNSDGVISGIPTTAGRYTSIGVTVSDSGYGTPPVGGEIKNLIITIDATSAAPTITSLSPPGVIGGGEAFTLTVNGTGFVSGSVVLWNGTPLSTGFFSATQLRASVPASAIESGGGAIVTVSNPGGVMSSPVTFQILGPSITSLTPPSVPAGVTGLTLTVNGANFASGATVTWNRQPLETTYVSATQLRAAVPAVYVSSRGTASVAVINPGSFISNSVLFTIDSPAPSVLTESLPNGTVGTRYQRQLEAGGGSPPYSNWTVITPQACIALADYYCRIPDGLELDPSGLIAGVPTRSGTFAFGVTVRDSAGAVSAIRNFTVRIATSAPVISTSTPLPAGRVGTAYAYTFSASGGVTPYLEWTVFSGVVPPGLTLNSRTGAITGTPTSSAGSPFRFTVVVRDSLQTASTPTAFFIEISDAGPLPTLTVAPSDLSFVYRSASAEVPRSSVSVFTGDRAIRFNVQAVGAPWIQLAAAQGTTPATIPITISAAGLSPGSHSGEIRISAENTNPLTRVVRVSLTVEQPPAPQLSVTPQRLTVATVEGSAPMERHLLVTNPGGGTVLFGAEVRTQPGEAWLTTSSAAGSVTREVPAEVTLRINPGGLRAGTYTAEVRLRASNVTQTQLVTVVLAVSASARPRSILLSQTGVEFVAVAGAGPPPSAQFSILNNAQSGMDYTLQTQTLSGDPDWLTVTPTSGSTTAGGPPGLATIAVKIERLTAGRYFGSIRVVSDGAANSPQSVAVGLTVLDPTQVAPPKVTPTGLILATRGTTQQTITVTNVSTALLTFTSSASTADGGTSLSMSPASGTIPGNQSLRLNVVASAGSLTDGFHNGTIRLSSSDGSVTTIETVLIVPPAASAAGGPKVRAASATRQLAMVFRSPETNFRVGARQPVTVRVEVRDDRGQPVTRGGLRLNSSLSDTLDLVHEGEGVWAKSWVPHRAQSPASLWASMVTTQGVDILVGQVVIPGTILASVGPNGGVADRIVNSASFAGDGVVSPGSWVSIFGEGLADNAGVAQQAPFPSEMAGTQVRIGSQPLPLYYVSAGQVNALIPFGLNQNTELQLDIQRGNTLSTAIDVVVAERQPAIFTMNQQGTGQGAILLASDARLAAPEGASPGSRPARAGEYIMIFATGLGSVANPPPDGGVGSGNLVLVPPQVRIGGVPASINFAGLAPGLVGVYQVNALIPDGIAAGDAVEVVLTVGNTSSNVVTIAVR